MAFCSVYSMTGIKTATNVVMWNMSSQESHNHMFLSAEPEPAAQHRSLGEPGELHRVNSFPLNECGTIRYKTWEKNISFACRTQCTPLYMLSVSASGGSPSLWSEQNDPSTTVFTVRIQTYGMFEAVSEKFLLSYLSLHSHLPDVNLEPSTYLSAINSPPLHCNNSTSLIILFSNSTSYPSTPSTLSYSAHLVGNLSVKKVF